VVVGDCALAKHEAGVVGWAKTRNQATAARLQASHVKQWQGMVRRVVRWCVQGDGGGGGLCTREMRGGGGGLGQKHATKPPWLGCGLEQDRRRWRGVLWGYKHPSHADLWSEMGGEVLWCYGWVVVWLCLPGTPSASPLLPTPSTPHS
jgi:hypothetical protein